MLGVYLLVCLAVFWLLRWKASRLTGNSAEPVTLGPERRTYHVCRRAVILKAVSSLAALMGYLGCLWPFLFIENIEHGNFVPVVLIFGVFPLVSVSITSYLDIKNAVGYIAISSEEIENKRKKSFTVKVSDIRKITPVTAELFHIHLFDKKEKPLPVDLRGFFDNRQALSLLRQVRDYSAELTGRKKSILYKLESWKLAVSVRKLFAVGLTSLLIYTSYCCIDYDVFKKDYTALFNAIGVEPGQSENAWDYYVQAAAHYIPLDNDTEEILKEQLESGTFALTDEQADMLRQWFQDNQTSWNAIRQAASIEYCNASYERISGPHTSGQRDFSAPMNDGYKQIRSIIQNAAVAGLSKTIDLDGLDVLNVQLAASKHFTSGKTFIDQVVGYSLLHPSVRLLATVEYTEAEDIRKIRDMLNLHFPAGLPPMSTEGEILMFSSILEDMFNFFEIPMQSPLNPSFLLFGSCSGTERFIRNRFEMQLKNARRGIEEKQDRLVYGFPIVRKMLVNTFAASISKLYQTSQRAAVSLQAGYVALDLEDHRLAHGHYPADISQLRQAGYTAELPDDPYSNNPIIYANDGRRAVLYSVGPNGIDDGGYRDEKGSGEKRDDTLYWHRES